LFAAFVLSLMAFLMNLKSGPLWLALAGPAVFSAALVWHSLRRRQPFLDVRMLARNWPLTMTYLRAAAISMIVFSVYYGFAAQRVRPWLQCHAGRGRDDRPLRRRASAQRRDDLSAARGDGNDRRRAPVIGL